MLRNIIVVAGKDPLLIDGGSESYLRAYGRAAMRAGYMPHFFSVATHDAVKETEFGVVHRTRSPFRPFRGLMVAAHQSYIVRAVDRFVGTETGPHLIHSFGGWGGVGLAVAKRLKHRHIDAIPIITAFGTYNHETRGKLRGLRVTERPLKWLQHVWELLWTRIAVDPNEGPGYRGSKVVLVNYDSVQRIISRQFGDGISFAKMTYASEAAFLKTGAVRDDMPEPIARLELKGLPLLIVVSRHDPRKGVDVLLRALAELRKQGTKFQACLIGGGQLLDAHRALVNQLGLSSSVTVPGRVPDAYAYLQYADVFALPSLEEGSGSVSLLEAMQAGAAAVVTRVDGLPEDVVDEESALLVEPGDVDGLAEALKRLFSDADLRSRIAAGGHQQYVERFSAEAFSADLQRVYCNLGFPPMPRFIAQN